MNETHELHENSISYFTPFLKKKNDIFIGQVSVSARQAGMPPLKGNLCPRWSGTRCCQLWQETCDASVCQVWEEITQGIHA